MKSLFFLAALLLQSFYSFGTDPIRVNNAQFPRLFANERGQPVMSWVERTSQAVTLVYRISPDGGLTFREPVRILLPGTTAAHGEDVPKLIFKGDGTRMVVYSLPKPMPDATRAGNLLYQLSRDGKTWSAARPVHRDTTAGKSHSYAEMTRLPNGEIGLIWLDDKLPGREGRTVRFTQTLPTGGFGPEVIIDSSACPCCRPGIAVDGRGRIYLTYRDLLPGGTRDISFVVSADGGQSFSQPKTLGDDRWNVNACPHSGPQLVAQGELVYATWYSGASGREGVRMARLDQPDQLALLPGAHRTHPQLGSGGANRMALAWEEMVGEAPDGYRQVMVRMTSETRGRQTVPVSTPGELTSLPVLLSADTGLLVAYQVWMGQESQVVLKRIPFF